MFVLLALGTADICVAHDADYRASLQDFTTFLESLSEKVIEADETIPELPVKDIVCSISSFAVLGASLTRVDIPHIPR